MTSAPKPVIICVDDESSVLESLKIQLRNAFANSYSYEMAESADEALDLMAELQQDQNIILVIVSDWLMPGIKGDELLIKIHQQFPHTVKVMLTGQANEEAIQRAIDEADLYACLPKPWNSEELINTIKSGLETL